MAAPAGGRATTERIPRREQEQTEAEERGVNPIVQLPNGLILQFAHPHSPQSGRPADAGVPAVMPVTARCLPAMDTGSQLTAESRGINGRSASRSPAALRLYHHLSLFISAAHHGAGAADCGVENARPAYPRRTL